MKHRIPFFYDYVLPNTVLPNALPVEMGIVNFIHTHYSDRLDTESFFDEDLDIPLNPFKRMFGDRMGDMPQSLRMNGSYLRNPCFNDRVDVYENSMYFGKRDLVQQGYNRYVYPIKVTLHFSRFTGTDDVGSKLNGEYFWKHISEEALKDLRAGHAVAFLDWSNENFIDQTDYANLHYAIRSSGIPKENIVLAVNSFNAQQVYESWFAPHEQRLQVRNLPYIINQISYFYATNKESRLNEAQFKSSRDTIRDNYFVFPIRRGRDHRFAMMFKFASDDTLSKADWSCLDNSSNFESAFSKANCFPLGYDIDACKRYYEQTPKSLNTEQGSTFYTVHGWNDKHAQPSANAYFYVATETYVHGIYRSMTEKVFKPVANFNPFLLVSFPGALEELRNLGFKTFSGFIDESYDLEKDPTKRMQMIAAEVKRLCSMSKEELHNWYWQMEDILLHNHNLIMNIYQTEKHSTEFINFLHNRVRNP
jgi:hypothetical protein